MQTQRDNSHLVTMKQEIYDEVLQASFVTKGEKQKNAKELVYVMLLGTLTAPMLLTAP